MISALDRTPKPIAPLPKPVTFEQFIDWYPDNSEYRYELRRGVIVPRPKPKGKHSELAGLIHKELAFEVQRNNVPYSIPRGGTIKTDSNTGYEPDIVVLERDALKNEPLWQRASTVEKSQSVRLVIEVVSSNWQDDYEIKLAAYERMGIKEYWIVDYAGLGGVRHIGKPKQPTLTICNLIEGEYEVTQLRGSDAISSLLFPELPLTAEQILNLES